MISSSCSQVSTTKLHKSSNTPLPGMPPSLTSHHVSYVSPSRREVENSEKSQHTTNNQSRVICRNIKATYTHQCVDIIHNHSIQSVPPRQATEISPQDRNILCATIYRTHLKSFVPTATGIPQIPKAHNGDDLLYPLPSNVPSLAVPHHPLPSTRSPSLPSLPSARPNHAPCGVCTCKCDDEKSRLVKLQGY